MLESDELKALPKQLEELEKFVTGLTADNDKSMTKAEERLVTMEDASKPFLGDFNKSLDRIDQNDRDATRIIDRRPERVRSLDQQVVRLSKK